MSGKAKLTVLAVVCSLAASSVAIASAPVDLHNGGDTHESIGQGNTQSLHPGVTYEASALPLSLRLRPPDDHWGGVQYESGRFRFVQLNHLRTGSVPLHGVGYITIEASTGPTGSVAQTVARLRATPHLQLGATTQTRVAGFTGQTFDATIIGIDHPPFCRTHTCPGRGGVSLAPFTTNHHCGFCTNTMKGETQDVKYADKGQLFKIIVIDVRGKTVVIYLESTYLEQPKYPPTQTFPTFLPYAQQLLATLHFPG